MGFSMHWKAALNHFTHRFPESQGQQVAGENEKSQSDACASERIASVACVRFKYRDAILGVVTT